MIGHLVVNGQDLASFGCYVTSDNSIFASAQADVESIKVPGRNGDLTFFSGKYNNVNVTYSAFIYENFSTNFSNLRGFLSSITDYARIEDTFHTDEYRLGYFYVEKRGFMPVVMNDMTMGHFTITFTCKPQRFLISGEPMEAISSGGVLTNPTPFESKPIIRTKGSGVVHVGNVSYTIKNNSGDYWIYVDSETQDAYTASGIDRNSYLTLNDGMFPTLPSGETTITFDNTFTAVQITPRWWML